MSLKKIKTNFYKSQITLVITGGIAGLLIAGSHVGLFRILEWVFLDLFFSVRPQEAIDNRIAIVTIDESDIKYVKKWPMSDAVMAQIIRNIKAQQPSAIAIDIYRDIPVEPGHQELVELFKNTPNLIGVQKSAGQPIAPPPTLAELGQVAAIDLVLDSDGKIRRGLILLPDANGNPVQGLGVKLALMYLKKEKIKLEAIDPDKQIYGLGKATFVPLSSSDGEYNESDMGGYQILLNYRGGLEHFPHISMTDVLENRIPPNFFRDRIIFLGAKAPSLNDSYSTPYHNNLFVPIDLIPGVVIHANMTSQILSAALEGRPMLRPTIKLFNYLLIVFWSGYSAVLGLFFIRKRWLTLGGIIIAGSIIITSSYIAFLFGWLVPVFTPLLAVVSAGIVSIGQVLWKNLMLSYRKLEDYARHLEDKVEERTRELFLEQQKTEELLLNILPSAIAAQLKESRTSIADYFDEATILFSDIVGFTQISSQVSPIELVSLLNQMFSMFDRLVEKYGLEKIKTIGDAYMVVGGLPIPQNNNIQSVAEMALEMQITIDRLPVNFDKKFQIRVGIHTGPVVAGVIGTKKFVYDLWGDAVNVASRMESTGLPGKIQVSQYVYERLKHQFLFEKRGLVEVKGKGEMQTYWLTGKKE